jgi:hypothetical protein
MLLVAGVAALAVLGLWVLLASGPQAPAGEDEPPSRSSPAAKRASALVVVTAIIRHDGAAIVAFAPPGRVGTALWDLPDRDWGTVTFASPPPCALEVLEAWERRGEELLLESLPDLHLVRLSDLDNPAEPLSLSAP